MLNMQHSTLTANPSEAPKALQVTRFDKTNVKPLLAKAYTSWNHSNAQKWLKNVQSSEKPLNKEQLKFMHRIIDRCHEEAKEFKSNAKMASETVRDCLLGHPGTGKSQCIKMVRIFFEQCLK